MAIIKIYNEQVASRCGELFKRHTVPDARAGCLHLYQWFVRMIIAGLDALIINLYPSLTDSRAIIKVKDNQHWWLAGGYALEIGHFRGG